MSDMHKTKDVQDIGIEFGDWKLVPVDSANWELCHRHVTARGKNAGDVKWHRLGRFYQCNTIGQALLYAADCEMRDGSRDAALDIIDALGKYDAILARMAAEVAEAVRG